MSKKRRKPSGEVKIRPLAEVTNCAEYLSRFEPKATKPEDKFCNTVIIIRLRDKQ